MSYAALGAAEFVRGVGLIASGALTYGLLGGVLPEGSGYDRLVAYASFATIAQILVSVGLSVLLILAGGPLAPHVAMLGLSTLLALAIRQGGATGATNG